MGRMSRWPLPQRVEVLERGDVERLPSCSSAGIGPLSSAVKGEERRECGILAELSGRPLRICRAAWEGPWELLISASMARAAFPWLTQISPRPCFLPGGIPVPELPAPGAPEKAKVVSLGFP